MTKNEMKDALELGGEFPLEVGHMEMKELLEFVDAAVHGGGKICLYKTNRLEASEIEYLCYRGGKHVAFPDMKYSD